MVVLEAEAYAVGEVERLDMGARELKAAGPVEHRELLGDDPMIAVAGQLRPSNGLAAGSAVADRHRAGHVLGDEGIVRHDDDGRPELTVHVPEQLEHLRRRRAVELARRLVSEDERRPVRQGNRDRDALLLATGQAIRPVVGAIGEPDEIEQLLGAAAPVASACKDHGQLDVLGRRQVREQVA